MKRILTAASLLALAGMAHAQSSNCTTLAPRALPVQPTVLPALAPELTAPSHQLGAPTGVLAQAYDETQSVDNVLLRMKLDACNNVASALTTPAPATKAAAGAAPAAGNVVDAATYKPQTKFDNTPWRFDMNQNGKRMTAEEFDAWMKARGVRVAKGNGGAAQSAPTPTTSPSATPVGSAPGTQPTSDKPKKPDGKH